MEQFSEVCYFMGKPRAKTKNEENETGTRRHAQQQGQYLLILCEEEQGCSENLWLPADVYVSD